MLQELSGLVKLALFTEGNENGFWIESVKDTGLSFGNQGRSPSPSLWDRVTLENSTKGV